MAFQISCANGRVTLELEGDNSVEQAAELHQKLLSAGAQNKEVNVKAEHSGAIDITVVQVLAALQTCSPGFRIERPSEQMLSSFDRCGMRRSFRAALKPEKKEKGT